MLCFIAAALMILSVTGFAKDTFNITYDYGVADIHSEKIINTNPFEFSKGQQISLSSPSCPGFEFKGWYLEPQYETPVTSIDSSQDCDISLYAKWYEMTYSISYVLETDGIDLSQDEITNLNQFSRLASETTYLSAPLCNTDVYTFDGWYTDSSYTNKVTYIDAYTCEDITLWAKWVNTEYSIHYDMGDVTQSIYTSENPNPNTYEFGKELPLLDAVTNDPSYFFDGWYTDEFFTERAESVKSGTSGDIVLYAKWNIKKYNVSYVLTDNSGIDEDDIHNYNSDIFEANTGLALSAPITDDKNYEFVGWFTSSDLSDASATDSIPAGTNNDVTLYAKWMPAVYKINYNYGIINTVMRPIDNPNPAQYRYGDAAKLEDIDADGFIFNGWCTDAALRERITSLPEDAFGDITLYADFTEKTYSISYVLDYGDVTASQVVNTNIGVRTTTQRIELEAPQTINSEYKFGGWYTDGEYTEKIENISGYTTGNLTLYAKWIKIVVYLPCWGDATLSEQLSAADARLILRYSAGLETGFSELQKKVSDINNDGNVNASDARLVLRLSAGIENEYDIKNQYSLPTIKVVDGEVVIK